MGRSRKKKRGEKDDDSDGNEGLDDQSFMSDSDNSVDSARTVKTSLLRIESSLRNTWSSILSSKDQKDYRQMLVRAGPQVDKILLTLKAVANYAPDVTTIDSKLLNLKTMITSIDEKLEDLKSTPKTYASATQSNVPKFTTASRTKAIPKTLPSLVMCGINEDLNHDDSLKELKQKVNFRNLKFAPVKTRNLSNNKVRIDLNTTEDRDKLIDAINETSTLKAEPSKKRRPLMILKGIPNDVNEDQLVEVIKHQNTHINHSIKNDEDLKFRFKRKNYSRTSSEKQYNAVVEVSPEVRAAILKEQRVAIDFVRVHAEDFSVFSQCYKCLGFGHIQTKCDKTAKCARCAQDHLTIECTITPEDLNKKTKTAKCYNCEQQNMKTTGKKSSTDHCATSKTCEVLRAYEKHTLTTIDYGS